MTAPLSIFLIDDDKLFIFLTKKIIKETDIVTDIKEFGDGKEAIDHIRAIASNTQLLPDMIFLDLSMPIMDGWDFLKEYIELEPSLGKKIKLYIFSSSISPHDIERAKNYSVVTDFVIKPIAKEKFMAMLDEQNG